MFMSPSYCRIVELLGSEQTITVTVIFWHHVFRISSSMGLYKIHHFLYHFVHNLYKISNYFLYKFFTTRCCFSNLVVSSFWYNLSSVFSICVNWYFIGASSFKFSEYRRRLNFANGIVPFYSKIII